MISKNILHLIPLFIALSTALVTNAALAENARILNHNFESDVLPISPSKIDYISGWVSTGTGEIGTMFPEGNQVHYNGIVSQAQVAYLNEGGRFSQLVGATLEKGETYTLTFDVGSRLDQLRRNIVARVKANGLVLAYQHSDKFTTGSGEWSTETFTFTATDDMPIGLPIALEFQNLATKPDHQVNIDNITLTIAGTGQITSIKENIELLVPELYPTIPDALNYLDDKLIQAGKVVTIKVTDCSNQTYTQPIEINHPDGQFIHIISGHDTPNNCTLKFTNSNGISVQSGHQLGLIDGFTLQGNRASNSKGILVNENGILRTGPNLKLYNFNYGLWAESNASVHAEKVQFYANSAYGLYANMDAYVNASLSSATNNSHSGIFANHSSVINGTGSLTQSNTSYGYFAQFNATLLSNKSTAKNHLQVGYSSYYRSVISATDADAQYNVSYNYRNSFANFYSNRFSYLYIQNANSRSSYLHHRPSVNTYGNSNSLINN